MQTFLPTHQTASLVFFNLCLLLVMYVLLKKTLWEPHIVASSNRVFTILLMFVFVLFSFWGKDWFGYQSSFEYLKNGNMGHMEEVYVWIAQNLSPNYLSFRFVIWGGSLCLLLHIFKRLSIPTDLAIFFFCTIYIIWFSYARVTLAMVLIYYGLTALYRPYASKLISIILGFSAIGCAYYFHKSAMFGIVAVLLTLVVDKFEKKIFIIMLLCYPILVYFAQYYLSDFLIADANSEDGVLGQSMVSGQRYLNKDVVMSSPLTLITSFFERFPHFLLSFISLLFVMSEYYDDVPSDIKAFIRLQFFLVLLSSLFMFDLGANTSVVYVRFMRFAVVPSCILLTYLYYVGFKFKYTQFAYYIAFAGTLYSLLYRIYKPL